MTADTKTAAATLRRMAKAAGLRNFRVRKGTGCRRGTVHFFAALDATSDDRAAARAFLASVDAVHLTPECRTVRIAENPDYFRFTESFTLIDFTA